MHTWECSEFWALLRSHNLLCELQHARRSTFEMSLMLLGKRSQSPTTVSVSLSLYSHTWLSENDCLATLWQYEYGKLFECMASESWAVPIFHKSTTRTYMCLNATQEESWWICPVCLNVRVQGRYVIAGLGERPPVNHASQIYHSSNLIPPSSRPTEVRPIALSFGGSSHYQFWAVLSRAHWPWHPLLPDKRGESTVWTTAILKWNLLFPTFMQGHIVFWPQHLVQVDIQSRTEIAGCVQIFIDLERRQISTAVPLEEVDFIMMIIMYFETNTKAWSLHVDVHTWRSWPDCLDRDRSWCHKVDLGFLNALSALLAWITNFTLRIVLPVATAWKVSGRVLLYVTRLHSGVQPKLQWRSHSTVWSEP